MPQEKKQKMLTERVEPLILQMAIPTIAAQLITTIYNLVDTYFVSGLGTNATAAVGVNASLERLITIIGSFIGAGACSYLARLLGAKQDQDADRVLSTSFYTGLFAGVLFMAVCRMNIGYIVRFLGATEECELFARQYAKYVLYAAPFMITSFILNMCLRSEGSATYALIGIGFGSILNCFLDPLFIRTLGMGVSGASLATAISKFVSFCILIAPYLRGKSLVKIHLRLFRYIWRDVKEVAKIGSTSLFRSALTVLAMISINRMAGYYSTSALAALSIANRVMEFPFAIILGFGQGYQPVIGYNWGARAWNRVKSSLRFGCLISLAGSVVIGCLIFLFAGRIIHLFNNEADPEVLRLCRLCIRLQCVSLPFHSLGSALTMFYAGIGYAADALLLNLARQGYCFFPVLYLAPRLYGLNGITAVQATADLLSGLVILPLGLKVLRILKEKEQEAAAPV